MRVERIVLKGVTTHDATELDLPAEGLVLITGGNGAGKSTIRQAVQFALWGKCDRKKLFRPRTKGAEIRVTAAGVEYTRKPSKPRLTWTGAPEYESDKHAQDALTARLGTADDWARGYLVTAGSTTFGESTDAERTKQLEASVGLDVLGAAYQVALEDQRNAAGHVRDCQTVATAKRATYTALQDTLDTMPAVAVPKPPAVLPSQLEAVLADVQAELQAVVAEPNTSELEARVAQLRRQRSAVPADVDTSDLDPSKVVDPDPEAPARLAALRHRKTQLHNAVKAVAAEIDDAKAELAKANADVDWAKRRVGEEKARMERLSDMHTSDVECPTCGQEISPEHVTRCADAVGDAEAAARKRAEDTDKLAESFKATVAELQDEARQLEAELQDVRDQISAETQAAERRRADEVGRVHNVISMRRAEAQARHDAEREALQAEIDQTQAAIAAATEAARERADITRARLREDIEAIRAQIADAKAELQAYEAAKSAAQTRDQLERKAEAAKRDADTADAELAAAKLEAEAAAQAVDVLGVRGVRSRLLGAACTAVETAANALLATASSAIRVHLVPSAPKADGTDSGKVGLTLEGVDASSYQDASGGERRMVDVALLLARIQVTEAARGQSGGTVWLDEALDCLHPSAVEGAAQMLRSFARGRCVVVVGHSAAPKLYDAADVHWHVEAGVVR